VDHPWNEISWAVFWTGWGNFNKVFAIHFPGGNIIFNLFLLDTRYIFFKYTRRRRLVDKTYFQISIFQIEKTEIDSTLKAVNQIAIEMNPVIIQVFDPTFLNSTLLNLAPSCIQGAGKGIYVSANVPKGTILGQYYGDIYPQKVKVPSQPEIQDRLFSTKERKTIVPHKECKSQYINDCINMERVEMIALEHLCEVCEEYNRPDFCDNDLRIAVRETMKLKDPDVIEFIHTHDESVLDYNVDWAEKFERVYITATRDIFAGEELFIDYGEDYWLYAIIKTMKTKYNMTVSSPQEVIKDRRTRRRKRPSQRGVPV
jgi:hypothetical protein